LATWYVQKFDVNWIAGEQTLAAKRRMGSRCVGRVGFGKRHLLLPWGWMQSIQSSRSHGFIF